MIGYFVFFLCFAFVCISSIFGLWAEMQREIEKGKANLQRMSKAFYKADSMCGVLAAENSVEVSLNDGGRPPKEMKIKVYFSDLEMKSVDTRVAVDRAIRKTISKAPHGFFHSVETDFKNKYINVWPESLNGRSGVIPVPRKELRRVNENVRKKKRGVKKRD